MNQDALYDTKLYDLVRKVGLDFSARAQGPGYHVVHTADKYGGSTKIFEDSVIRRVLAGSNRTYYYVKDRSTPLVIDTWRFRWREGTSAISLDFGATFELRANNPQAACALVKAIHGHGDPSAALHGIIDECLHAVLTREFEACERARLDILSIFNSSEARIGESRSLNDDVSRAACHALGVGAGAFRIGFLLQNHPPFLVEVKNTARFTLADGELPRSVNTEAQLKLKSYQSFKKSGLKTEAEIRAAMDAEIAAAVRKLLFGQKYYEIVEKFEHPIDSIKVSMRNEIQAAAAAIGYDVVMFQTYPDIKALALLSPLRIDMDGPGCPEESRCKYYLRQSGYVHVEISLSVEAKEKKFDRLQRLISPDTSDVKLPIIQRVQQICGDEIRKSSRKQFNLEFQSEIVPQLDEAITRGLGQDGLVAQIIKINQLLTEEAIRYRAITTQTSPFRITISAHANAGDADKIEMTGHIEITGIDANAGESWDKFESKDFGFRRDSVHDDDGLRRMARLAAPPGQEIQLSDASPLPTAERRHVAIQLELLEIRKRVESTLRERLSKLPDLAAFWRSRERSIRVVEFAQKEASEAIQSEFGLNITLRGVVRGDTASEEANAIIRAEKLRLVKDAARHDVDQELRSIASDGEARIAISEAARAGEIERVSATGELPERLADVSKADSDAMAAGRISLKSARQLLAQPSSLEASNHDGTMAKLFADSHSASPQAPSDPPVDDAKGEASSAGPSKTPTSSPEGS